MIILNKQSAPRYERQDGIISYLFASQITCNTTYLTTSLVKINSEGFQRIHHHVPEQVYYIISGRGIMTVGDESKPVESGDCIFIFSNMNHGLTNNGDDVLTYFSAAAPSFDPDKLKSYWPIKSETYPYLNPLDQVNR